MNTVVHVQSSATSSTRAYSKAMAPLAAQVHRMPMPTTEVNQLVGEIVAIEANPSAWLRAQSATPPS